MAFSFEIKYLLKEQNKESGCQGTKLLFYFFGEKGTKILYLLQ